MDAESLAQIEQIVTTAIGKETGTLRREFDEKLTEKVEEVKRHNGVFYEEVLRRIDLVVEGHQALHQKIEKLETRMEHEFLETRSHMQLS